MAEDAEWDDDRDNEPPPPSRGFEDFVRDNPIGAVIGALFVGILLGRMGIL